MNTTTAKDHVVAGRLVYRVGNVSTPTLTLYPAKANSTGAAVVVFPGGGYRILAIDLEGTEVCDWLNSIRRHLRASEIPRAGFRALSQIAGCAAGRTTSARHGSRPCGGVAH